MKYILIYVYLNEISSLVMFRILNILVYELDVNVNVTLCMCFGQSS